MTQFSKDNNFPKGEIVIYKAKEGPVLDMRLEEDTVWLTQKQIAELFDKGVPTVNEHIKNVYKERELEQSSTIRNFRIVQKEGGRIVKRNTDYYSLDVIISVGYRTKSQRGTQRPAITKHLNNIFKSGELDKNSASSILEHTAADGETHTHSVL